MMRCRLVVEAIDLCRSRLTVISVHLSRMLVRVDRHLRYRRGQTVVGRRDGIEWNLSVLH